MPAKRKFNVKDFLELLHIKSLSTGEMARKLKCNRGTALKYLRELKAKKQVMETRISNTLNLWKIHKKDKQLPHVAHSKGYCEWYTPEPYIRAATSAMEGIDLDPASTDIANNVVKAKQIYTAIDDGLTKDWSGKVWLNPPYSSELITRFCDKLLKHFTRQEVTEAIVLVNNATETSWFNKLISYASAVMFPNSRIRFWSPDGRVSQPLQGQAIIYLGDNIDKFVRHFEQFGWSSKLR